MIFFCINEFASSFVNPAYVFSGKMTEIKISPVGREGEVLRRVLTLPTSFKVGGYNDWFRMYVFNTWKFIFFYNHVSRIAWDRSRITKAKIRYLCNIVKFILSD